MVSNGERALVRFLDALEWIIDFVIRLALILVLLISGFSLYDTYKIYNEASYGSRYSRYHPLSDGDDSGISFGELMELNPDVVGWITLDDTSIDYPVVQGRNNSQYLNKDALGGYSLAGSIFMDFSNARDFSDPYTLLYGHHMEHDVMFGGLDHFKSPSYFEEHQTGKLWISDNAYYELMVAACMTTDAYDPYVFRTGADDEDQETFLKQLYEHVEENSVCSRDFSDKTAPLLGLSTCADAGTNERTVVFCTINSLIEEELDETSD